MRARAWLVALVCVGGAGCLAQAGDERDEGLQQPMLLAAVLARVAESPDLDQAVRVALAAGLAVDGQLEPSLEGRSALVVDPAAPDVVYMALVESPVLRTSRPARSAKAGGTRADCRVRYRTAQEFLNVLQDGNVYALEGKYGVQLDVCRPGAEFECEGVRAATDGARFITDIFGAAQSAPGDPAAAGQELFVTAAPLSSETLANAFVAATASGPPRTRCTVTLNRTSPRMLDILRNDPWRAQSLMEHEIGHCLGLGHPPANRGDVMDPVESGNLVFTSDEVSAIRRVAAGGAVPVTECRGACPAGTVYDASEDRCRCGPGRIGLAGIACIPWGD